MRDHPNRVHPLFIGSAVVAALILITALAFVFLFARPHTASAVDKPRGAAAPLCATLHVQIHEHSTPSAQCVETGSGQLLTPLTAQDTPCQGSTLWLFSEQDQQGARICFSGQGSVNLDKIPFGDSVWNDIADSYWATCSRGTFYSDPEQAGRSQDYTHNQKGNFDGNWWPWSGIQSGTLSSLTISGSDGC